MYSGVLIFPFTFLPDNTKIHAFCVFRQENEWKNKNSTVCILVSSILLSPQGEPGSVGPGLRVEQTQRAADEEDRHG